MDYCIFSRKVRVPCPKKTCCAVMGTQCCLSCRDRKRCQGRCPRIDEKLSDLHRRQK